LLASLAPDEQHVLQQLLAKWLADFEH
jgi:hypothetical protein